MNNDFNSQINDHQEKHYLKFNQSKTVTVGSTKPIELENVTKSNLVIGVSMIKHIQGNKMERAAGGTTCHSFIGAN